MDKKQPKPYDELTEAELKDNIIHLSNLIEEENVYLLKQSQLPVTNYRKYNIYYAKKRIDQYTIERSTLIKAFRNRLKSSRDNR